MPAVKNARKKNAPKASRPFGSVTKFPGSSIFCREVGKNPGHLYRVLTGQRQSERLVNDFAAWLQKQNLPWPKAAKVKPTIKLAA